MKIKDFFTLIIKLFGLYWLIAALLSGIPNQVLFVLQSPIAFSTSQLILFIGALLLTPMLFVALLFFAPHLTKRLRLERHFEDELKEVKQEKSLKNDLQKPWNNIARVLPLSCWLECLGGWYYKFTNPI